MLMPLIAAALLAAQAGQPKAKAEPDRLVLRNGKTVEGTVTKETFTAVEINITGGAPTKYAPADILKLEYGDMPPSLKNAMADIEAGNFQDALQKVNSAEESVDRGEVRVKPRRQLWFDAWVLYYRGQCQKELARPDEALKALKKLIEKHKDCRFLPDAYEMVLEAYRDKGDLAGADAFIKEIDKAPEQIRGQLKKRAQKQQAEIHLEKKEIDKARPILEQLARDSDPQIRAEATAGLIRVHALSKNRDDLRRFCEQTLSSATESGLMLLASNALGEMYFEQKMYDKARGHFVDSVVRFHPGRGSPLLREHEKAIYHLARCYEELAAASKDEAKKSFQIMAGRTYRELALEYPAGKHREEASRKAGQLDKTD